ncbi:MAG: lipopolysaccharide kinase InaA family protein [Planctomycetota bacterium]
MQIPDGYVAYDRDGIVGVVRADLAELPPAAFFADGDALPAARGRGEGVRVLRLGDGPVAVARTYRRGGALRGVLCDQFLDSQRPCREVAALNALRVAGVDAVEPLAGLARRDGALFQLRLLTALVEGALPLPAFVASRPEMRRAAVARAGAVVAAAFAAGLRHRDLHPDNLVASAGETGPVVHLLDLDRATLRAPVPIPVRLAMLTRMARYLVRHRASLPTTVARTDGLRFLRGLRLDREHRQAYARAISARLRRQLTLRRWFGR